jgi:prohibitin 1
MFGPRKIWQPCCCHFRPDALPQIFTTLGLDYDDRVLPSITNEVLKAVVAQFDAGELITQREMVKKRSFYAKAQRAVF